MSVLEGNLQSPHLLSLKSWTHRNVNLIGSYLSSFVYRISTGMNASLPGPNLDSRPNSKNMWQVDRGKIRRTRRWTEVLIGFGYWYLLVASTDEVIVLQLYIGRGIQIEIQKTMSQLIYHHRNVKLSRKLYFSINFGTTWLENESLCACFALQIW